MKTLNCFGVLIVLCFLGTAQAQESYVYVPKTLSKEWARSLAKFPDPALLPAFPAPDNLEGWKQIHQWSIAQFKPLADSAVQRYDPTIAARKLGGV
jgi:hypothetical protein